MPKFRTFLIFPSTTTNFQLPTSITKFQENTMALTDAGAMIRDGSEWDQAQAKVVLKETKGPGPLHANGCAGYPECWGCGCGDGGCKNCGYCYDGNVSNDDESPGSTDWESRIEELDSSKPTTASPLATTTSLALLPGEQRMEDGSRLFRPNPGGVFDYHVRFFPKTRQVQAGTWLCSIDEALHWLEGAPTCVECHWGGCLGPCNDLIAGSEYVKHWSSL